MTINEVPFHTVSKLHTAMMLKHVHDKHGIGCSEEEYKRLYNALIVQFLEEMPDKCLAGQMTDMPLKEIGKLIHSSPD